MLAREPTTEMQRMESGVSSPFANSTADLNLRESLVYLVRQLQTRLIGHSNVADQYINGLFLQNPPRLLKRKPSSSGNLDQLFFADDGIVF